MTTMSSSAAVENERYPFGETHGSEHKGGAQWGGPRSHERIVGRHGPHGSLPGHGTSCFCPAACTADSPEPAAGSIT